MTTSALQRGDVGGLVLVRVLQAIGPQYGGLEEAKADVAGMFGLKWLVDHGVLPKEKLEEYFFCCSCIFSSITF